jgi:hypothetical protein
VVFGVQQAFQMHRCGGFCRWVGLGAPTVQPSQGQQRQLSSLKMGADPSRTCGEGSFQVPTLGRQLDGGSSTGLLQARS